MGNKNSGYSQVAQNETLTGRTHTEGITVVPPRLPANISYSEDDGMYIPYVDVAYERNCTATSVRHKFTGVPLGKYRFLEDAIKRQQEVVKLIEAHQKQKNERKFKERLKVIGMEHLLEMEDHKKHLKIS